MTKRKAATLMGDVKVASEAVFKAWHYQSWKHGHAIDQMLRMYAEHNGYIWTVGSNLWSMQFVWYDDGKPGDQLMGMFYQDLWRTKTTISI